MSVKPILFNTEMVTAILDGRKTVTRRVVKPQPEENKIHRLGYCIAGNKNDIGKFGFGSDEYGGIVSWERPPYNPDDILYIRETWCDRWLPDGFLTGPDRYGYKADGTPKYGYWGNDSQCKTEVWIPSIHMPKEAARIWLKVTNVRVERLRNITTAQAQSEGTEYACNKKCRSFKWCDDDMVLKGGCECFSKLWDTTIKKTDISRYGWSANPWVWVIEFERCEKPQEVSH